jgi:hypothetical protein
VGRKSCFSKTGSGNFSIEGLNEGIYFLHLEEMNKVFKIAVY